jgi:hypothetical protein
MNADFQINPVELTGMDQTAYLHLDNKIGAVQTELQTRVDSSETRMTVQIGSVRTEFTGFMQEIRAELKRLNESQSRDGGAKHLIGWSIPLCIAVAQLLHDFHK